MKEFYKSKTFWFNVLAILVLVANQFGFAEFQLNKDVALVIVVVLNFILRFLTNTGITLRKT